MHSILMIVKGQISVSFDKLFDSNENRELKDVPLLVN